MKIAKPWLSACLSAACLFCFTVFSSAEVTRFPNGISTHSVGQTLADLPIPDPAGVFVYFDDFTNIGFSPVHGGYVLLATDTDAQAPSATIRDATYGVLRLTPTNDAGNGIILDTTAEYFSFGTTDIWFRARAKILNPSQSFRLGLAPAVGLSATNATTTASAVFFQSDPTSGVRSRQLGTVPIDFVISAIERGAGGMSIASDIGRVETGTWFTVGFHYDKSASKFKYFLNDALMGALADTNAPTEELGVSAAIITAQTDTSGWLDIDYLCAIQDR